MKRLFDLSCSLILLIILSPVMATVAIWVRIKLGSPVLFKQKRPGLHGKPFYIYKFRTMKDEKDRNGQLLPDEKRLTPFGVFLRRYSLDEFPQLFNVMKGDLSLVGPRPLLMEYLKFYTPEQARRHEVRPGITGWAQVNGRNAITWEEKFELDLWYVNNHSLWLDMKILLITIGKVLKKEGINAQNHVTAPMFKGAKSGMERSVKRIYLSLPHIGDLERQFVEEAFATNWLAPLGPHVDTFERELAEYVGSAGAVALNSGTAAIHLALRLAEAGPGDTVFCSTLTFIGSANPILYQGAEPVFIDSEPQSWNMSPSALHRALLDAKKEGKLPKAVIVVNLYGQSADMTRLMEICDHFGVPIIEDAAESLGAIYKGKASGTFGKLGIYSFNGNKVITTSGGGMLVSDDLELLHQARFWAAQSRDPARHYQHSELGYNYRLSNVLAGIGRGQLRKLKDRINSRRMVFARYYAELSGIDGFQFMPEVPDGRSTRWLTALTVDSSRCGVSAVQMIDALAQNNIEARPVWKPLHLQPLFKGSVYYPHSTHESISESLFKNGLCLPSSSNLSEDDQSRVIECIKKYIGKA